MARFFTSVLPAISATFLFAACVDLTPPWAGRVDVSDQGGQVPSDVAAGGDGGSSVVDAYGGSGGAGGNASTVDVEAGGTSTGGAGGVPTTGGTTGTAVADAADGPAAEVAEELCKGGGLVVGVEAAGVGEDPGVAAAEAGLLEADAGVFDAGDDAVGSDADEGDDGGAPAFDFGFEAPATGAKFAGDNRVVVAGVTVKPTKA